MIEIFWLIYTLVLVHCKCKMVKTRQQKEARAEYMRSYRAKASDEKNAEWKRQRNERRKKQAEREAAEKETLLAEEVRLKNEQLRTKKSEYNRRAYIKSKEKKLVMPTTPSSKVKLIDSIISSATPSTSAVMLDHNLDTSNNRSALKDIVSATSSLVKSSPRVRKKLLPKLGQANKKAVARKLGINRSHFYYTSKKGLNPKISKETVENVVKFYNQPHVITMYPNKRKNGAPLKVMKYTRKATYHMFCEEFPRNKLSLSTFNILKPKAVKLRKHSRWFQCLCDICDNVKMLCHSIKLSMSQSHLECPEILNDGNEFKLAQAVVCDIHNYNCLERKCAVCSTSDLLRPYLNQWIDNDKNAKVNYFKWARVPELVKGKTHKAQKDSCLRVSLGAV